MPSSHGFGYRSHGIVVMLQRKFPYVRHQRHTQTQTRLHPLRTPSKSTESTPFWVTTSNRLYMSILWPHTHSHSPTHTHTLTRTDQARRCSRYGVRFAQPPTRETHNINSTVDHRWLVLFRSRLPGWHLAASGCCATDPAGAIVTCSERLPVVTGRVDEWH